MIKEQKRKERGITLIALVVTIIVLLILAGITIATLFGDNGVINKAQKAKDETDRTAIKEQEGLNKMEEDMENAIKGNASQGNTWTQPDQLKPEITNGEITIKIGDYVDYSCKNSTATYTSSASRSGYTGDQTFKANSYNYGWRVLGVDKDTKQLQLISEDLVPCTSSGNEMMRKIIENKYVLGVQESFENGIEELNRICTIYGTGAGALSARTVNVEDIDKITGYNPNNTGVKDPNKTGSGRKCYSGQVYEYGNNVKYTLLSTGVKYEPTNSVASGTNTNYKQFTYYDEASKTWKSLATNESVTLKSSTYHYYPTTLTETNDVNATVGIKSTSPEYKMLFSNSSIGSDKTNEEEKDNSYYWLGSSYVHTFVGNAEFGLRVVHENNVSKPPISLIEGNIINYSHSYGIRPVISLDQKVQLKDSGTMKDGCKLYNMKAK